MPSQFESMSGTTILILLIIGFAAGLLSGLVGIGGGIVIVPALIYFLGLNQKMAQGTSLAMLSLPVALIGAYNYYRQGQVHWKYALILAATFIVGGYIGSKITLGLDMGIVKKIFAVMMLVLAIRYLFFDK